MHLSVSILWIIIRPFRKIFFCALSSLLNSTPVLANNTKASSCIRESRYFSVETIHCTWMKKNGRGLFDVTMRCFDGAEVCELVETYALSKIAHEINSRDVILYRDDGLAVLRDVTGSKADRMRKTVCKIFNNLGLRLTIDTVMKAVNVLDVTLNLADGTYRPYRKPNDTPVYVHSQSNHPPTIIKQIPKAISRRLTDISSNQDAFREAAPL